MYFIRLPSRCKDNEFNLNIKIIQTNIYKIFRNVQQDQVWSTIFDLGYFSLISISPRIGSNREGRATIKQMHLIFESMEE